MLHLAGSKKVFSGFITGRARECCGHNFWLSLAVSHGVSFRSNCYMLVYVFCCDVGWSCSLCALCMRDCLSFFNYLLSPLAVALCSLVAVGCCCEILNSAHTNTVYIGTCGKRHRRHLQNEFRASSMQPRSLVMLPYTSSKGGCGALLGTKSSNMEEMAFKFNFIYKR